MPGTASSVHNRKKSNHPRRATIHPVVALTSVRGTAAFTAYIARATNPRYTATQFALFTSLAVVPRSLVNASTGWIVERLGWVDFYLLCALLAAPGMALLLRVAPWFGGEGGGGGHESAEVQRDRASRS